MPVQSYFENKPDVKAIRFEAASHDDVLAFLAKARPVITGNVIEFGSLIPGLDERVTARHGDWLIRWENGGPDGLFSSCPHEVFNTSFLPVE
jgi:hypothetical protein